MSAPLVRCIGLTKTYGDVVAVRDVSFDLWPGEILSILGSSGSGKTTVLRLVAGLEAPTAPTLLGGREQAEHEFLYWEFSSTGQQAVRMGVEG